MAVGDVFSQCHLMRNVVQQKTVIGLGLRNFADERLLSADEQQINSSYYQ